MKRSIAAVFTWILLALIHGYRLGISPVLGATCRYLPTCSAYAEQAIRIHGPLRGSWLSARRVLRCHPLRPGGYDPVPEGNDGA